MSNFFDDLLTGHLSRRQLMSALAVVPSVGIAAAQTKPAGQENSTAQDGRRSLQSGKHRRRRPHRTQLLPGLDQDQ